jgi:hypothetical protein
MSLRSRLLLVFAVGAIALGPALALPHLSLHTPTLTADTPATPTSPHSSPLLPLAPMAGVAIKVKDAGTISQKWKQRATQAQADYGTGVANAGADWEAGATAAEDTYGAAVTAAVADKRYGRGVRGSAGKYQKNASTLGPQRYGQGVGAAQDAYATGMAPVLQTLAGINLPARNVKGNNQQRSQLVADRLRAMKLGKTS